ncbi:hypothetical protein D932_01756 [Enterococcus casseliflavus 14-MB-W-14]|nr:hypothetical protein D932_01756 [Enterococcus casseliflavus 14-MB-W-14]
MATRLLKVFLRKDKSSHNKSRESNVVFVQSCSLNGCLFYVKIAKATKER